MDPSSGVSQTVAVQVCLWHIKPRTSECAEEKKREQNLIYAAVNLTPEYNRRLRLTFCTIEAILTDTKNRAVSLQQQSFMSVVS